MSKLYINQIFNTTTKDRIIPNHTNNYISSIALLLFHWLKTRSTGILRLSLIHTKWLNIRPAKFTRSEISRAIDHLANFGLVEIQVDAKSNDLLLILISQQKK
jgi:hypothetical protein